MNKAIGKAFLTASLLFLILGVFLGYFLAPEEALTRFETVTVTKKSTVTLTVTETHITTVKDVLTTIAKEFSTTTITKFKTSAGKVYAICFPRSMGGCEELLLDLIGRANKSIHVMIYSFTLDDLADALITAHSRGVDVKIIVEKDNAYIRGSEVERLLKAGVKVALDSNPYLMHNKVMIVDGKFVVTGSYNWSWSAENRNDENVIVIIDEEVAMSYEEEFNRLWAEATG